MAYVIPSDPIRSAGKRMEQLSDELYRLSQKAQIINGNISRCYMQGGVGGKMAAAAEKMSKNAYGFKTKAVGFKNAATVYENLETSLAASGRAAASAIKCGYNVDWASNPISTAVLSQNAIAVPPAIECFKNVHPYIKNNTVGRAVMNAGSKIRTGAAKLRDSYVNKGTVYKLAQYGKTVYKIGKGLIKTAAGVTGIVSGGGVALGVLSVINGVNEIANGLKDMQYINEGKYDSIGTTNYLKDTLVKNGGEIGELLGNRKAGEFVGKAIYVGSEVVTTLDSIDKVSQAFGNVQVSVTNTYSPDHPLFGKCDFDSSIFRVNKWYDVKGHFRNLFISRGSTFDLVAIAADKTKGAIKGAWKLGNDIVDLTNSI